MSDTIKVVKYYNNAGELFYGIRLNGNQVDCALNEEVAISKANTLANHIKNGAQPEEEILTITI